MKTWKEGKLYRFQDLTSQGKVDAKLHFSKESEAKKARYRFMMLSQYDLMEMLAGSYGPDLNEALNDPYVKELEENIRLHGLENPTVGGEGMHRLLAQARIGKGAPYFGIEYED